MSFINLHNMKKHQLSAGVFHIMMWELKDGSPRPVDEGGEIKALPEL